MPNYEEDVITINDGDIIEIGPNDIVLGMKSDGTGLVILRWRAKRL